MVIKRNKLRAIISCSFKNFFSYRLSNSMYLQNSKPNELKFSSVIWLSGEKREKKKGEEKREGRDALLITEPSAKSWRVANSTGSWDRGMGEGGWGREEGGRRAWGGCVVEEGNRRGGNRVSREQMWERKKWGTIRTLKLWDEFPERIWQAGRNVAIK